MFHWFSKFDVGLVFKCTSFWSLDTTIKHRTNTSLVTKVSENFERTIQKRTKLQTYVTPESA